MSTREAVVAIVALVFAFGFVLWSSLAPEPCASEVRAVELRAVRLPLRIPVTATAYNSEPAQTDTSPFIEAVGDDLRRLWARGLAPIAVSRDVERFAPMGSTVWVRETPFFVADRIPCQAGWCADLWFLSKPEALKWGRRQVVLEIRP